MDSLHEPQRTKRWCNLQKDTPGPPRITPQVLGWYYGPTTTVVTTDKLRYSKVIRITPDGHGSFERFKLSGATCKPSRITKVCQGITGAWLRTDPGPNLDHTLRHIEHRLEIVLNTASSYTGIAKYLILSRTAPVMLPGRSYSWLVDVTPSRPIGFSLLHSGWLCPK